MAVATGVKARKGQDASMTTGTMIATGTVMGTVTDRAEGGGRTLPSRTQPKHPDAKEGGGKPDWGSPQALPSSR